MTKKEYLIALGENLKKIREDKDISLSELARRCEKDRQTIKRVEKGISNPTAYFLHQLAEALDIDASKFLKF